MAVTTRGQAFAVSATSQLASPPVAAEASDTTLDPPPVHPVAVMEAGPEWSAMCGDRSDERPSAYGLEQEGFAVTVNGARSVALFADYDCPTCPGRLTLADSGEWTCPACEPATKEEVMARKNNTLAAAKKWLEQYLAAGEKRLQEVREDGAAAGHSMASIRRASDELLPVEKKRVGYGGEGYGVWSWNAELAAQLAAAPVEPEPLVDELGQAVVGEVPPTWGETPDPDLAEALLGRVELIEPDMLRAELVVVCLEFAERVFGAVRAEVEQELGR